MHDRVVTGRGQRAAIGRKTHAADKAHMVGNSEYFALAKLPQMVPLEAAQVFSPGFRPKTIENFLDSRQVTLLKHLSGQIQPRRIEVPPALGDGTLRSVALFHF